MYHQFLEYITKFKLIANGERILLAISGGIDSMVMADLFIRTGIQIGIAHCNFSLRGHESDEDEEMVRVFAAKCRVSFYTIRFKTEEFANQNGISIQMAARELRYEWFEKIRKENNYDSIAVAHTLNDNIETLLINLTRGTGVAGLSGIKKSSERIIRPLLFATRESITEYQIKHNIKFREDRSNSETKYIRNKIRHLVIPLLKEINPSVEFTLNETAERMSSINDIINIYIADLGNKIFTRGSSRLSTDLKKLNPYLDNKTIIYELFKPFGVTNNNLEELYKIFNGKTGAQLETSTHKVLKNRSEIIITLQSDNYNVAVIAKCVADLKNIPGIISARTVKKTKRFRIISESTTASLNLDTISFPLIIRKWKAGDFFYPLGMNQKKKLSDYFIDRKFSRADKDKVRVMESDGRIIWIIGEKIDNRFRVTDFTENVLLIKAGTEAQRLRGSGA
jgi:tRNA(Ile)-lysidine synthase